MNRHAALRVSTVAALWVAHVAIAYAATPATLVRDLRRLPGPNLSSSPRSMISLGGLALFWARTPQLGAELYRTDGTAEGTALLTDLCPGPCDSYGSVESVVAGGRAYFLAADGARGVELWSSNGTGPGTRSFIDLAPGPADGIYLSLLAGGDRVLFLTFGPALSGWDLWSSDGSPAGSALFARLSGEPGGGVSVPEGAGSPRPMPGGLKLYVRNFTSDEVDELWESDGTASGTRRVLNLRRDAGESICSGEADDLPRVVAGDFYFAAATAATGCELWRVSNGVAAPFADLAAGGVGSSPRSFVRQGEWTLFVADLPGAPDSLWTTDGTPAGTLPAAASGKPAGALPVYLGSHSSGAYFAAETPEQGRELWFTGGAPGEFRPLGDFVPGADSSDPQRAGVVGERVYFWTSHPDRGIELNVAVPGAVRSVARVRERDFFGSLAGAGERAVFGADLGLGLGVELAATEGSPESTGLLRDLSPGDPSSYPRQLTRVGGRFLFTAIDDTHGGEVWRSDGTAAGTQLVADLTPGPAGGAFLLAPTASGVVLAAPDGSIRHARAQSGGIDFLFRPESEVRGANSGFRLGARGLFFAPVGDESNSRFELWRADGRPEGSRRLAEISRFDPFFGYSVVSAVDPIRRRAFFIPVTADSAETGPKNQGLWITDGTAAGTRRVLANACGGCAGGIGEAIVGPGGRFIYTADDFGEDVSQLWASDGTTAGTVQLTEAPGLVDGDPIRALARLGELLLFAASDPEHGQELWVSDGTPAGTRLLANLRPGSASSWPDGITVVGARAFFSADDGIVGRELWATDGTAEGTYRVADLRQGTRSSVPQNLTAIGNRLVFAAADDRYGLEVWSSDGTVAGTRLASDVQVGRLPSSPGDFVALGSELLFVAARVGTGRELFRLPLASLEEP